MRTFISGFILISFCSLLIQAGCFKAEDDIEEEKLTNESLKGSWRLEATRFVTDTLNPNAWRLMNYNKVSQSKELYCVYDTRKDKSFLSENNCTYSNAPFSIVVVENCSGQVFNTETTWYQQIKYDLSFTDQNQFNWQEVMRFSRRLNLYDQPCTPLAYEPEKDVAHEAKGKWSFDETSNIITVDYSPGFSRIDGQYINKFRIKSFTGEGLIVQHLRLNGDEYKLRKM